MKKIIVACGSGVATSQTVASKVNSLLEDRGLSCKAEVEAVDIKSIDMYIKTADIYICITPFDPEEFNIPSFSGIPFLTGIGLNEIMDTIVEEINK